MYEVPKNLLRFEDGAKINQTTDGLRLVRPDGTSEPVQAVTVYANSAVAYQIDDKTLYEGRLK